MEAKNPEKAGSLHAIDHELNQQVADKKIMQKNTWNEVYEDNSLHTNNQSQDYRPLNQLSSDEVDVLRKN